MCRILEQSVPINKSKSFARANDDDRGDADDGDADDDAAAESNKIVPFVSWFQPIFGGISASASFFFLSLQKISFLLEPELTQEREEYVVASKLSVDIADVVVVVAEQELVVFFVISLPPWLLVVDLP